mmetsp:Transcript_9188/g.19899  ORF Transcript_9188/g.19899 Transcript_9188/m.19899 type:complete len:441 (+) Transcript_9188:1048-2370(+)
MVLAAPQRDAHQFAAVHLNGPEHVGHTLFQPHCIQHGHPIPSIGTRRGTAVASEHGEHTIAVHHRQRALVGEPRPRKRRARTQRRDFSRDDGGSRDPIHDGVSHQLRPVPRGGRGSVVEHGDEAITAHDGNGLAGYPVDGTLDARDGEEAEESTTGDDRTPAAPCSASQSPLPVWQPRAPVLVSHPPERLEAVEVHPAPSRARRPLPPPAPVAPYGPDDNRVQSSLVIDIVLIIRVGGVLEQVRREHGPLVPHGADDVPHVVGEGNGPPPPDEAGRLVEGDVHEVQVRVGALVVVGAEGDDADVVPAEDAAGLAKGGGGGGKRRLEGREVVAVVGSEGCGGDRIAMAIKLNVILDSAVIFLSLRIIFFALGNLVFVRRLDGIVVLDVAIVVILLVTCRTLRRQFDGTIVLKVIVLFITGLGLVVNELGRLILLARFPLPG